MRQFTDEETRALLALSCDRVFCNALELTFPGSGDVLRFIDNTEDLGGWSARGFDLTPPAPGAEDGAATVSIDDSDALLAEAFQAAQPDEGIGAAISLVDATGSEPEVCEGPYLYKVKGFSKSSATGVVQLELERLAGLDAYASRSRYSAQDFPGLYG